MTGNYESKLWVPGLELEFEPYGQEQLFEDWSEIYNAGDTSSVAEVGQGILGVLNLPEKPPARIASVDLCDVIRETHVASAIAVGKTREHIGSDRWIYTGTLGLDREVSPEVVKAVMNADLVEPVGEIEEIKKIMQGWREQGVYTVANTSTLPNCEKATIENLLARELPGCFDGLVLPRNHYGDGKTTKGDALQAVASKVSAEQGIGVERAVHIDDAPHHIRDVSGVIGRVANEGMVIIPVYEPGKLASYREPVEVAPGVIKSDSPLEAFEKATEFLLK